MNAEMTSLNLALSTGHPADSQHCLFTLAKENNCYNAIEKSAFFAHQNISVIEGKTSIKQRGSRYQHESSLPGVTCATPDYTL